MRKTTLSVLVLIAASALAAGATQALASKRATRSQTSTLTRAVRSTPVAGVNRVPAKRYAVTNVRISTVSPAWAMASLTPTRAGRNNFQPAKALAVKLSGTGRWVVVDVGSAEVGCGIAPNAVLADLLGLRSGESPCPPGEGIS